VETLRRCERRTGKIEMFNAKPGEAQVRVRIGEQVFNLPSSHRGVLKADGSIRHCVNGERSQVLAEDSLVVVDLIYDFQGKDPIPGLWAPKVKRPQP